MNWRRTVETILEEYRILQVKTVNMFRNKIPERLNYEIERLSKRKRIYKLVDSVSNNILIVIFMLALSSIAVLSDSSDPWLVSGAVLIITIIIINVIHSDWNRKAKIKQMYITLADHLQEELQLGEGEDHDELPQGEQGKYFDKIEDIINIRDIIERFESDSRIRNNIRTKWYQVWNPSLISYLNEFYGYPESVIYNRIEFQQKLFERVVLTGVIGFSFLIIRSVSFPFSLDMSGLLSTIILLIFLITLLLLVSFPVVRFPALKLEMTKWIEELGLSLNSINEHPPRLLNEDEFSTDILNTHPL